MIVTEADLRDQLRRPHHGAAVTVPAGARLSPAAADFVKEWALVVDEVRADLGGSEIGGSDRSAPTQQARHQEGPAWDTRSVFPVNLGGELPTCVCCGMRVTEKTDGLTQLNAAHFAAKTHPRIKLRGHIDTLHALVLLIQRVAKQEGEPELVRELRTVAAYCRELTSAEYNERPVAPLELEGWDTERIHQATHDPRGTLGVEHLTIDEDEVELQHWLNVARATSRQIEIAALEAFPSPHDPYGASICHAFNRLSSAFYLLQLRLKAGVLA